MTMFVVPLLAFQIQVAFQASKIGLRKVFLHEFVYDASKDIMAHLIRGSLSSHHNFSNFYHQQLSNPTS